MPPRSPPIPSNFTVRKTAILTSLSVPTSDYQDASPKGSIDEGIRDLIDEINTMPGIVTTSSCAGRISVFLEGAKPLREDEKDVDHNSGRSKGIVPGGKGGGKWLFVSHDPMASTPASDEGKTWMEHFGLSTRSTRDGACARPSAKARLARFAFEPMILHIMTASLHHAQPILAAAINAGFRESGVQSLRNLEDENTFPMVAVRSAGLGLESLVGVLDEGDMVGTGGLDEEGKSREEYGKVLSLVDEGYLTLLVEIANERFIANRERVQRFREGLAKVGNEGVGWESSDVRRERKRKEGLERKRDLEMRKRREEDMISTSQIRFADSVLDGLLLD